MYENFYEPYVSIENNVKEAANNAASHSVSSNICTELETIVNDLRNLKFFLDSEETDETVKSFSSGVSTNLSTIESVYDFLVSDYVNVEQVYQLLKTDLDLLKELDSKLKTACDSEPKQSDYDDVAKYNEAHDLWKNNVETIKNDCINVKSRIDEYLDYLKSINCCVPTNGASGIQVSSLSIVPIESTDLSDFNYSEIQVDGITYVKTRWADTDVWYAIIPKGLEPKLAVAHNSNGDVTSMAPSALANEVGAKLAINFSLTGTGYIYDKRKAYMGGGSGILYDGENLYKSRTNYHDTTLYMDKNGNLGFFYNDPSKNNGQTPEQKLKEVDAQWAAKTFFPIAVDGQYVDENKDPNIGGNSVNPRTFIGQTNNGDYFVGVCTGRNSDNTKQKGMTLKEVYDFSQEVTGGNIKFLMNGDGGGSSAFVYDGKKLNPNTDKSERARPDIIYWA